MTELLKKYIKDKKVLILGFGREGRSTLNKVLKAGGYSSVSVADKNPVSDALEPSVKLLCGDDYQSSLDDYDIVIKSPGVVLDKPFSSYKCRITSQTEIFIEKYSKSIIGITGTKGKSTTTTLIYHILSVCGVDCVLAGNIGIPSFDVADKMTDSTVVVYELSCHQLENTRFSPHLAVFLNLFEEHLDHYGTFENYANAKRNIYRHQSQEDYLVCLSSLRPDDAVSHVLCASMTDQNADIVCSDSYISFPGNKIDVDKIETNLVGRHNLYNLAIAFAVCSMYSVKTEDMLKAAKTYKTLPHRLEFVASVNGVSYYDDSISTMGQSTIQAVKSLKNVGTVLIGGMDRGIEYTDLIDYLYNNPVNNIILMSDSGKRIMKEINQKYPGSKLSENIIYCSSLQSAVEKAKQVAVPGTTCVMSPAAASYNEFRNFEQRGECYKSYVINK